MPFDIPVMLSAKTETAFSPVLYPYPHSGNPGRTAPSSWPGTGGQSPRDPSAAAAGTCISAEE